VIAETIYLTWTASECLRQTFSSPWNAPQRLVSAHFGRWVCRRDIQP
jgi:hypothetical protein